MPASFHESMPTYNPSTDTEPESLRPSDGRKIYHPTDTDTIVEPESGQVYKITQLQSELLGTEFGTRLFMPEEPVTDEVLLFAYGLGSSSLLHEAEADELVRRGYPLALHEEPRLHQLPDLKKILEEKEAFEEYVKDLLNPLIFASEALSSVMDTIDHHTDTHGGKFGVKGHSKGGPVAAMLAAHEPQVGTLILDAPAGFVRKNALWNHASSLVPIVRDEVVPMAKHLMATGPEDTKERMMKYFGASPRRLAAEILLLIARSPDIRPLLMEVKDRDPSTNIVVMSHENDRFFHRGDMDKAASPLLDQGLIDIYERVMGTKHVNPNINPRGSADVYERVIGDLALKQIVAHNSRLVGAGRTR